MQKPIFLLPKQNNIQPWYLRVLFEQVLNWRTTFLPEFVLVLLSERMTRPQRLLEYKDIEVCNLCVWVIKGLFEIVLVLLQIQ